MLNHFLANVTYFVTDMETDESSSVQKLHIVKAPNKNTARKKVKRYYRHLLMRMSNPSWAYELGDIELTTQIM